MFKLNTIQLTKSGENLMPFVVDGDTVSCFTKDKKVVYRKLSDFDFSSPPSKKEVVIVQSREDINTDNLFTGEPTVNEITEPVPEVIEPTFVIEPEPEPVIEPEPEPVIEPEPVSSGSIWDTVDDDYI